MFFGQKMVGKYVTIKKQLNNLKLLQGHLMKYMIYGTAGCGFCLEAKRLLDRLDIPYGYRDISEMDEQDKQTLQDIAGIKFRTVPQIFTLELMDMQYVGGYTELKAMVSND